MARDKTGKSRRKSEPADAGEGYTKGGLFEQGLAVRREVLGDEYVDRALAGADEFNRPLQELVTEYCWGAVWTRPGLSRRDRSLLNLAMLTALNRPHEVEAHMRGALRNGCSREEIRETLLHAAIYCGVPAAVDSFRIARAVLAEADGEQKPAKRRTKRAG